MAKDTPYGSFEEMIGALNDHIAGMHSGGEVIRPSVALAALRAAQARYAAPVPFKPGDVVTPRELMPVKGRGDPHVVLEVGSPPASHLSDRDTSSSGFGARPDVRVLCFMAGHVAAFWMESWTLEPMAVAADDLPPEAQGPDEAAAKANG